MKKHVIRDSWGRNAQSSELKTMLGLDPKAKLPADGMPAQEIQGYTVYIRPLDAKSSARRVHRVRAICPRCKKDLSAGRLHQHTC